MGRRRSCPRRPARDRHRGNSAARSTVRALITVVGVRYQLLARPRLCEMPSAFGAASLVWSEKKIGRWGPRHDLKTCPKNWRYQRAGEEGTSQASPYCVVTS